MSRPLQRPVVSKYDKPKPVATDDPNGIRLMTDNVVGPFTQSAIDQVVELQQKQDKFKYVPQDSDGGLVADNGTDALYSFQSNLRPIERILRRPFYRSGDDDEDMEEDSEAAGTKNKSATENDLRQARDDAVARLSDDAYNNQYITTERERLMKLQQFAKGIHNVAGNAAGTLEVLETTDNLDHPNFMTARDEARTYFHLIGDLDKQVRVFTMMLRLRNDQLNAALSVIGDLYGLLKNEVMERARMNAAVKDGGDDTVTASVEVLALRRRVAALTREQEYLYRRVYGPKQKGDVRVDNVKRYRREVDETYEAMVEAEVTRRLHIALNHETHAKKLRKDLAMFRGVAEKSHRIMEKSRWVTTAALKANKGLEMSEMLQHDAYLFELNYEKAATAAMVAMQRNTYSATGSFVLSSTGGNATDDFGSSVLASLSSDAAKVLKYATDALARESTQATTRAIDAVSDAARASDYPEESVKVMCAAIGETGTVLSGALSTATTQLFTVLQLLPESVRRTVMEAASRTLMDQGKMVIRASMKQLTEAIKLPVKDRKKVFERMLDSVRKNQIADYENSTGKVYRSDDSVSNAAVMAFQKQQQQGQHGSGHGSKGSGSHGPRSILETAFPQPTPPPSTPMTPEEKPTPGIPSPTISPATASLPHSALARRKSKVSMTNIVFAADGHSEGGRRSEPLRVPPSRKGGDRRVSVASASSMRSEVQTRQSSESNSQRGSSVALKSAGSLRKGVSGKHAAHGEGYHGSGTVSSSHHRKQQSPSHKATKDPTASSSRQKKSRTSKRIGGDSGSFRADFKFGADPSRVDDGGDSAGDGSAGEYEEDDTIDESEPREYDTDDESNATVLLEEPVRIQMADVSTMTEEEAKACRDPKCRLYPATGPKPAYAVDGEATALGDDELVLRPRRQQLLMANAAAYNNAVIVLVSVGVSQAVWRACPDETPELLRAAIAAVTDTAADLGAYVFREDADYVGVLFKEPLVACRFAALVQAALRGVRIGPKPLELPELAEVRDLQGRLVHRGIRPRIAVHRGCPFIGLHSNVPGDNGPGPAIGSTAVCEVGDAVLTCGPGEVLFTDTQLAAIAPFLTPSQWPTEVPAPPGAFKRPGDETVQRMRIATRTVTGQMLASVSFGDDAAATAAGAGAELPRFTPPMVDKSSVASTTTLLQLWLDGLKASLGSAAFDRLCFVTMEVQSDSGIPVTDPRTSELIARSQQLLVAEIHALVTRYDGLVTAEEGLPCSPSSPWRRTVWAACSPLRSARCSWRYRRSWSARRRGLRRYSRTTI
jgi:hypothetical protein